MTFVLGRDGGDCPTADLGVYRALDGSDGAPVALDLDAPHAVTVVGKRGYGKSHTLAVLAEELVVLGLERFDLLLDELVDLAVYQFNFLADAEIHRCGASRSRIRSSGIAFSPMAIYLTNTVPARHRSGRQIARRICFRSLDPAP